MPQAEATHEVPVLRDDRNRWFFERHATTTLDPVGVAIIAGGSVHGHNGGQYLAADGEYLWDLGRENWRYFGSFYLDSALRLPRPRRLRGRVAVLAHEYAYDNFSHWIFDVLPKIGLLKNARLFDDIDWFLVGHSDRPYQIETLRALGVPASKIVRMTPDTYLTADEIIVPRLCGYHSTHYRGWSLDYVASEFSRTRATTERRLFVSREDAAFRKVRGEDELYARLAPLGFEKVKLTGMTLADTVALFQSARGVIGAYGSGLMNIAFCAAGASVVEIATPSFYNCYHWYLSSERKLRHAVYFGDDGMLRADRPPNQLTRDITIDVDDCFQFIEQFIQ